VGPWANSLRLSFVHLQHVQKLEKSVYTIVDEYVSLSNLWPKRVISYKNTDKLSWTIYIIKDDDVLSHSFSLFLFIYLFIYCLKRGKGTMTYVQKEGKGISPWGMSVCLWRRHNSIIDLNILRCQLLEIFRVTNPLQEF
jgi:hypothetical protein